MRSSSPYTDAFLLHYIFITGSARSKSSTDRPKIFLAEVCDFYAPRSMMEKFKKAKGGNDQNMRPWTGKCTAGYLALMLLMALLFLNLGSQFEELHQLSLLHKQTELAADSTAQYLSGTHDPAAAILSSARNDGHNLDSQTRGKGSMEAEFTEGFALLLLLAAFVYTALHHQGKAGRKVLDSSSITSRQYIIRYLEQQDGIKGKEKTV